METQATLPLLPVLPPIGRPDPDAAAIRRSTEVEYKPLTVRGILNRNLSPRLPFAWTLNPYRGCEFACTYRYARYTHGFFDLTDWRDFERRIFVKQGAAEALRRQLERTDLRGQAIAIGTASDPYQPAERQFRVTRSLLEELRLVEGLNLTIATKSPLVLRDLDLLVELDRRHAVTVALSVTTLDPALARRIERRAPDPQARLRTLRRLTAAGIATRVHCMPLMPGINDGADELEPLFEAARDGGAEDVIPNPLSLRSAARARFWPWLEREFPHLEKRYRKLYGRRDVLRPADSATALATFRRLRAQFGFPHPRLGRG